MLELNKIYCMDCLEGMKQIDDNSIDFILSDLPYGNTANVWDKQISLELLWYQFKRIIKAESAIALTGTQPFISKLVMSNIDMFKYDWIWEKSQMGNFLCSKFQPLRIHEHIAIFSKYAASYVKNKKNIIFNHQFSNGEPYKKKNTGKKYNSQSCFRKGTYAIDHNSSGYRHPKSILKFSNSNHNSFHPTQKPLGLFRYLISTYSKQNDIVLDCCMGSGTTAVACKQLHRNFIGFEINPKYVEIANKRLLQETLSSSLTRFQEVQKC